MSIDSIDLVGGEGDVCMHCNPWLAIAAPAAAEAHHRPRPRAPSPSSPPTSPRNRSRPTVRSSTPSLMGSPSAPTTRSSNSAAAFQGESPAPHANLFPFHGNPLDRALQFRSICDSHTMCGCYFYLERWLISSYDVICEHGCTLSF